MILKIFNDYNIFVLDDFLETKNNKIITYDPEDSIIPYKS